MKPSAHQMPKAKVATTTTSCRRSVSILHLHTVQKNLIYLLLLLRCHSYFSENIRFYIFALKLGCQKIICRPSFYLFLYLYLSTTFFYFLFSSSFFPKHFLAIIIFVLFIRLTFFFRFSLPLSLPFASTFPKSMFSTCI